MAGHPGAGKTVLASSIIDSLDSSVYTQERGHRQVYYYFFEYASTNSSVATAAYRAILTQILWQNRDNRAVLDRFSFIMESKSQGQMISSESILVELLGLCINDRSILVVDGVDECRDNDSFISTLLKISQHSPGASILLLSRVNVASLMHSVPFEMQLHLRGFSQDIGFFCQSQLQTLFEQGLLPESARDQLQGMTDRLRRGADGMFLWAKLMFKFLRAPFITPRQRVAAINRINTPEGLEAMYERIFSCILGAGQTSTNLASRILAWLAFSMVEMSSKQVQHALAAEELTSTASDADQVSEFEDSAIMACAGLVERVTTNDMLLHTRRTTSLRLVHLSVKEIIEGSWDSQKLSTTNIRDLIVHPTTARIQLANCCLRQLLFHTQAQPLSVTLNLQDSVDEFEDLPCFTAYAAVHWLILLQASIYPSRRASQAHATRSTAEHEAMKRAVSNFMETLSSFLKEPTVLSKWLECFYMAKRQRKALGFSHPPGSILRDWASAIMKSFDQHVEPFNPGIFQIIQEFVKSLGKVVKTWGDKLEACPKIIWDEMTGIVESPFFFSPKSTRISFQRPERPKRQTTSQDCVALMSRTSENGNLKGVLSIWAPE